MKAIFECIELNTDIVCNLGETKKIRIPYAGKPDHIIEVGLMQGDDGNFSPFIRSRGKTYFGGESNHWVHFRNCYVEFSDTGSVINSNMQFDRFNRVPGYVVCGDHAYGLRDAWQQEPAKISCSDDGTVKVYFLDDSNQNYVYPTMPQGWNTPGDDQMEGRSHSVRGGWMKMWDIYKVPANKTHLIDISRNTAAKPDLAGLIGLHGQSVKELRPERLTQIINSCKTTQPYSAFWYFMRANDRINFRADEDPWAPSMDAKNIGWKTWPDLWWNDGMYNLGYDWLLTAIRMWYETNSTLWYNLVERWAKFAATTGICWSTDATNIKEELDPTEKGFVGFAKYGGRQWYEKTLTSSQHEVGSFNRPTEYKRYIHGLLAAQKIFPNSWWIDDAVKYMSERLLQDQENNWSGQWGHRTAAWKMINCVDAYKYLRDERFSVEAIDQAQDFINKCKEIEIEDPKWKNLDIGYPYVPQPTYFVKNSAQSWMIAKVAYGLILTGLYCNCTSQQRNLFLEKAKQMGSFLTQECLVDAGSTLLNKGFIHYNKVKCFYAAGNTPVNLGSKLGGGLSWLVTPIGFAALKGDKFAKEIYPKIAHDYAAYPDVNIGQLVDFQKWDGHCSLKQSEDGNFTLTHGGVSTADLKVGNVGHHIYLKWNNEQTWHRIVSLDGDSSIVITNALKKNNRPDPVNQLQPLDPEKSISSRDLSEIHYFMATGPQVEDCINDKDWAVRVESYNMIELPDDSTFSWNHGSHFNTWWKNVGFVLYQWDTPTAILALLSSSSKPI